MSISERIQATTSIDSLVNIANSTNICFGTQIAKKVYQIAGKSAKEVEDCIFRIKDGKTRNSIARYYIEKNPNQNIYANIDCLGWVDETAWSQNEVKCILLIRIFDSTEEICYEDAVNIIERVTDEQFTDDVVELALKYAEDDLKAEALCDVIRMTHAIHNFIIEYCNQKKIENLYLAYLFFRRMDESEPLCEKARRLIIKQITPYCCPSPNSSSERLKHIGWILETCMFSKKKQAKVNNGLIRAMQQRYAIRGYYELAELLETQEEEFILEFIRKSCHKKCIQNEEQIMILLDSIDVTRNKEHEDLLIKYAESKEWKLDKEEMSERRLNCELNEVLRKNGKNENETITSKIIELRTEIKSHEMSSAELKQLYIDEGDKMQKRLREEVERLMTISWE